MVAHRWVDTKTEKLHVLDDLMDIYKALLEGKTSDPARLSFKVDTLWLSLTRDQQRAFQRRMRAAGMIDDELQHYLNEVNGTFSKLPGAERNV